MKFKFRQTRARMPVTLREDLCTILNISSSVLLRTRPVSGKFVEKIRAHTHILCSITCSKTLPFVRKCSKKKIFGARQATDDNTAHAHCKPTNQGYKHTLRISNTYCFYTPSIIARTRLIVTPYVHWLPCLTFGMVTNTATLTTRTSRLE